MSKQDKILVYGFAAFSALTSFLFVYYAVSINFSGTATQWLKTFAYVAGGYGLMNIYILSWAWRSRAPWSSMANLVIAACFFGVFTMDTLREGFVAGINGLGGILALGAVLAINWYATKTICAKKTS